MHNIVYNIINMIDFVEVLHMTQPVIAILRWESGHVPAGLMQLEQMPGNSTNPRSYPFPVKLVEVKGANVETVITHPSQTLLLLSAAASSFCTADYRRRSHCRRYYG